MQPGKEIPERYDYSKAGFGAFLTRSIDDVGQTSLGVDTNTQSRAVAFDRQQVSGAFGDTVKVGSSIAINGPGENIILSDGDNNRLLIGRDDGGF